jgi:uncharacterized protein (DUF4415 family)
MSANARNTKRPPALPTLDDLANGKVTLDEYEAAHGEDIPEWTDEDFVHARPTREIFPEIVEAFEKMRGQRGPQKTPTKERIGLRLDRDVVAHFRATGPGWQSRINKVLADHIKSAGK